METRTLPHNSEAEQSVLGSVLLDNQALAKAARIIKPEDFYHDANQYIFKTMIEMQSKMESVDVLTLTNRLEAAGKIDSVGGSGYLVSLVTNTVTASNAAHYARIVKEQAVKRRLVMAGHQIIEIGHNAQDAEKGLQEAGNQILGINPHSEGESHRVGEILTEYEGLQERYAEAFRNGKQILGMSTGFAELDEMTQGFREHHLWLLGGATSSGKTYMSLNWVRWLLEQGKRVVYYSLEMSKVDLISRLMAVMTEYPPQYILKGLMTPEERVKYDMMKAFLEQSDFTIYSEMHDLDQIKLSMIEESMKGKVDCFFLDYVQLVTRTGKEYDDMRAAATEFQSLMGQLKTPMVMLSQLSNEAVKTPNSLVSGFKGAGNLVQAADFGIEIWHGEKTVEEYREKLTKGIPAKVKVQVKKNRHGRAGAIEMTFASYTGTFQEN